jgi:hypothetical protein
MSRRIHTPFFLMLILAGGGLGQTPPPPAAANTRIYILLKPRVAEPGDARDAFAHRMADLGVINLQFVTGAAAARCEAPVSAQTAIGADADVTGVLPMDAATQATPPAAPPAAPAPVTPPPTQGPAPATPPPTQGPAPVTPPPSQGPAPVTPPPTQGPIISTPPYIPPQQSIPISAGVPMGAGMSAGMAMLTDFAGSMVVKLLTPGSSCKIRLHGPAPAIPAAGGEGAFEVKATGNCAWQAVSTADWLHVKSEVNVAGTVVVLYSAAKNPGEHRQTVVVIQPVAGLAPLKGHAVTLVAQQ